MSLPAPATAASARSSLNDAGARPAAGASCRLLGERRSASRPPVALSAVVGVVRACVLPGQSCTLSPSFSFIVRAGQQFLDPQRVLAVRSAVVAVHHRHAVDLGLDVLGNVDRMTSPAFMFEQLLERRRGVCRARRRARPRRSGSAASAGAPSACRTSSVSPCDRLSRARRGSARSSSRACRSGSRR